MPRQDRAERQDEVDPPHPERERRPGEAEDDDVERPAGALGADQRVDGDGRAEQALAQRDDHQQPVALGDVVGVPRRAAVAGLGEHRPGELHEQQDRDPHERDADRRLGDQQDDPPGLGHQERLTYFVAGGAARRVLAGGAQPLEDQRQAHDDVAGHHDPVVDRVAVVEGREHVGQAEGEDQHAQHLHHRGQPEDPVVGVVGRGEPGEVDPRPRDAERGEGEPEQRRPDVALGEQMGQLVRGRAERDDEGQVEEELQRGRGAVVFGRVASAHPDPVMAAVLDHWGV